MKPMYSDILKELRKDKRLTQKDMGDLMGISQTTYCDYENGVRRMPLAMLSFSPSAVTVILLTGSI